GRLENRREILEDAVRLGRNTSRHQLARRRVLADLTAEIDETAGVNGLGKRAHRRREFRRGHCGLAHGRLLWTVGSTDLLTPYDREPTIPQLHNHHNDIDRYARSATG